MVIDGRQSFQHGKENKKHFSKSNKRFAQSNASYHRKNAPREANWYRAEEYTDRGAIDLDDESVAIKGFVCPDVQGFTGRIKERYADFIVHEVDSQGRVVQLTSLLKRRRPFMQIIDQTFRGLLKAKDTNSKGKDDGTKEETIILICRVLAHKKKTIDKEAEKAMEAYKFRVLIQRVAKELGDKKGKEFEVFLNKVKTQQNLQKQKDDMSASATYKSCSEDELEFYIIGLNEKKSRVYLHETIRQFGKKLIIAETVTTATKGQVIRVSAVRTDASGKTQRETRRDWPVNLPDYLQFVLYKRNMDTPSILSQLATQLHIPVSTFSFAEKKVKRAVTTQLCTVYRVQKERFQRFARDMHELKRFQSSIVGNICYAACKASEESIKGNRFTIVIRQVPDEISEDILHVRIDKWVKHGFLNFYAPHNFGSRKLPLQLLGRAVLRKDFKQAYVLLLRTQEGEASKVREAREHFRKHKDVSAALRMFPPFLVAERALLEGLLKQGVEAHELAFQNIPEPIRISYVSAYQKYIWNQMASMRITKSSTSLILGDLVLAGGEVPSAGGSSTNVVVIDELNMDKYTIEDVVLPVPGYAVQYPKNETGEEYTKKLCQDGVQFEKWITQDQEAGNKGLYGVKGFYRYLIRKPEDPSFKLIKYHDASEELIATDMDRLLLNEDEIASIENRSDTSGAMKALVLDFFLPTSTDATIALRELLKQDSHLLNGVRTDDLAKTGKGPCSGKDSDAKPEKVVQTKRANPSQANQPKRHKIAIGRPGFSLGRF